MVTAKELLEATGHIAAATLRIPTQAVAAGMLRNIYGLNIINDATSRDGSAMLHVEHVTDQGTVQLKDTFQFTTIREQVILPNFYRITKDSLPMYTFPPGYFTRFRSVRGTVRIRILFAEES